MVSDALWLRFVRRCSFQVRVKPIERWDFAQKTLKIPVERLVPLHLWIPAHANRRDVPAARRLERGEEELKNPFCACNTRRTQKGGCNSTSPPSSRLGAGPSPSITSAGNLRLSGNHHIPRYM